MAIIPKAQTRKVKIDKEDYINLKSFYTAKEIINKIKRQPIKLENTFANHLSDEGLISEIYKEHKTSRWEKKIFLMGKEPGKDNIQMANRYMKRCSPSLIIREIQIKTITMYHLRPLRIAIIKETK